MTTYTRHDLARALRELAARPVRDEQTLHEWYGHARRIQTAMAALPEDLPQFHFLMHYLIDADVRLKDPAYRALQEEKLASVLRELEE